MKCEAPVSETVSGDVVLVREPVPRVALYRQILPDPVLLRGASIREIAERGGELCAGAQGQWMVHSFSALERGGERRAGLVEETFLENLKKRNRSFLRQRSEAGEALLQFCILSEEMAAVSFVPDVNDASVKNFLVPVCGGRVDIPEDKRPPSRAYRKLKEALASSKLAIQEGERVVDLGASPGSWSFVALASGADVVGVDRSPLVDNLMKHPRFDFHQGDAFTYEPTARVDWLLSDVICAPERSVQLLDRWLSQRLCSKFCVTMKFKGEIAWGAVQAMRELLDEKAARYLLRHLENNKNEITAVGVTA